MCLVKELAWILANSWSWNLMLCWGSSFLTISIIPDGSKLLENQSQYLWFLGTSENFRLKQNGDLCDIEGTSNRPSCSWEKAGRGTDAAVPEVLLPENPTNEIRVMHSIGQIGQGRRWLIKGVSILSLRMPTTGFRNQHGDFEWVGKPPSLLNLLSHL